LVALEVALSVPLLVVAGLLTQTILELRTTALGFDPERALTFEVRTPRDGDRYREAWRMTINRLRAGGQAGDTLAAATASPAGTGLVMRQLEERLRAVPGVRAVGHGWNIFGGSLTGPANPSGAPGGGDLRAEYRFVSPDFFESMGTRVLAGRTFLDHEMDGVAVIDDALATRAWPGDNPLGKQLLVELGVSFSLQVVGVVETVRASHLAEEGRGAVFMPAQAFAADGAAFVIRTSVEEPVTLAAPITESIQSLEPDMSPLNMSTLQAYLGRTQAANRLVFVLITVFAVCAFTMALVGLYAALAYSVGQRSRDVGIRVALGAEPSSVLSLFFGEGLRVTMVGLVVGELIAWSAAHTVAAFLYEVSPHDPITFGFVAGLVAAVALAACVVPSWRATRIDPVVVLRAE
jgi:hypothetical protein